MRNLKILRQDPTTLLFCNSAKIGLTASNQRDQLLHADIIIQRQLQYDSLNLEWQTDP